MAELIKTNIKIFIFLIALFGNCLLIYGITKKNANNLKNVIMNIGSKSQIEFDSLTNNILQKLQLFERWHTIAFWGFMALGLYVKWWLLIIVYILMALSNPETIWVRERNRLK